jgi:pimeloyl-ACP methyl ester carboxylesterase
MSTHELRSNYLKLEEGIEMHYLEKGEGKPLIFIPGLTFSGEIFSNQIDYFSKSRHVIAIDPRSQGLSTMTLHGNDYMTHGLDLAKLIEELDLDDITLVGWSTGNLDLWSYVRQFGTGRLRAAVTIDMSPVPLSSDPKDWTEAGIEDLRQVFTQVLTTPEGTREFFSEYATEVMLEGKATPDRLAYILDLSARTPYYICSALFANAVFSDFSETAEKISREIPSLMFIARHWAPVAESYMKTRFPKTETLVMGGHLMFYEYPDQWNAALENFLAKL